MFRGAPVGTASSSLPTLPRLAPNAGPSQPPLQPLAAQRQVEGRDSLAPGQHSQAAHLRHQRAQQHHARAAAVRRHVRHRQRHVGLCRHPQLALVAPAAGQATLALCSRGSSACHRACHCLCGQRALLGCWCTRASAPPTEQWALHTQSLHSTQKARSPESVGVLKGERGAGGDDVPARTPAAAHSYACRPRWLPSCNYVLAVGHTRQRGNTAPFRCSKKQQRAAHSSWSRNSERSASLALAVTTQARTPSALATAAAYDTCSAPGSFRRRRSQRAPHAPAAGRWLLECEQRRGSGGAACWAASWAELRGRASHRAAQRPLALHHVYRNVAHQQQRGPAGGAAWGRRQADSGSELR